MSRQDTITGMFRDRFDEEASAALQLSLTAGVGPLVVAQLLAEFGDLRSVAVASLARLQATAGVGPQLAQRIVAGQRNPELIDELTRCAERGTKILARGTVDYPRMLAEIYDPPTVLYVDGELLPQDALAVGIVGTRQPTRYGIRQAERLASSLARVGVTIVSGLARGIDAVVHRAALQAGGRTIAVTAGGLLQLYPPEHAELATQIAAHGAVVTEMPMTAKPRRGSFPRRNRLISGLSLGAIVVEASLRSGALITTRHAMEQGREVFAVPGPIDSRNSRGCHQLLRDGAKLVESAADVLDELGPLVQPTTSSEGFEVRDPIELQLNDQEQLVLEAIDSTATSVDQIVVRSQLPVHRILATLSVLEMRRLVHRLSGDQVARR